ncbi:D-alanyl-D-alanine carboxypeptidase/D-alanyl-D-alanine endopeptidase [Allostreptomyces psammosilenae]|uniref:D-alanyl-D-alanine carboxypeptidase n=1 Tax=Allostreptomyces psammosilenae TaxID=1892865 RepID=A0A853A4P7_9ACTN|nr:D-alanyl-D-alanine carboxypeptidase/D-alanyl-D-alanine-endopeptidase [Allostreptomyces psammosilenae]NYI05671.1 D-alanyl-D-alanine carboxypeptidase [Allostreptomyces psammosilenae]
MRRTLATALLLPVLLTGAACDRDDAAGTAGEAPGGAGTAGGLPELGAGLSVLQPVIGEGGLVVGGQAPPVAADEGAGARLPTSDGLRQALAPLLTDRSLGSVSVAVADALTGELIYQLDASDPSVPASTNKILTAVAALSRLDGGQGIATRVVRADDGRIVLVGGGDPLLTGEGGPEAARETFDRLRAAGDAATGTGASGPAGGTGPARLADLAARTALALRAEGVDSVRVGYDTSRYEGPQRHPIGVNENIAKTVPLMVDEGREDPTTTRNAPRVVNPEVDAARLFADMLAACGITVEGEVESVTVPEELLPTPVPAPSVSTRGDAGRGGDGSAEAAGGTGADAEASVDTLRAGPQARGDLAGLPDGGASLGITDEAPLDSPPLDAAAPGGPSLVPGTPSAPAAPAPGGGAAGSADSDAAGSSDSAGEREPAGPVLAEVRSEPVATLVERMLTESDNDLAEALVRQVAIVEQRPASFEGAAQAVADVLTHAGLDIGRAEFADGSGLDRANRIPAQLLVQALALAASPEHPELRPALTGLPVAGFTGTLDGRYRPDAGDAGADAAGLVRAKTGSLTGVNTLAGLVVDADGGLLAFAFLSNDSPDAVAARASLDAMAGVLAECGCG